MENYALKKEYTGILNISSKPGDNITSEDKERLKEQIKGQTVDMCGTSYLIVDSWVDGEDIWYKAVINDKDKLKEEKDALLINGID